MVVRVEVDERARAAGGPTVASDGLSAVLADGRRVLLEFQGSLEAASAAGTPVGELTAPPGSAEAALVLGTQRLAGRVVRLGHPLAVLEAGARPGEVCVAQLITEKIVFDARPSTVFSGESAAGL